MCQTSIGNKLIIIQNQDLSLQNKDRSCKTKTNIIAPILLVWDQFF